MAQPDWNSVLGRYGRDLHAVAGVGHHVVSPLGAWMVVALCGDLAGPDPGAGVDLGPALGADPGEAFRFARSLLAHPHPLVGAAAGVWAREPHHTDRLRRWWDHLPRQVGTGDVPSPEELDRWTGQRTLGLIPRFPVRVDPGVVCLLASALATKVSWEVPFQVVDGSRLGPSRWDPEPGRVLATPPDPRHRQYVAETPEAGPVAVHLARARGGLLVGSVIAADRSVGPGPVLAAAGRIVTAEAGDPGTVPRTSLFDLPLGPGPVWDVTEEPPEVGGPAAPDERFTTVMPAWSAATDVDLAASADLGFPAAAAAVGRAVGLPGWKFDARQSAAARYSATGFEAAAVTSLARLASLRAPTRSAARRATIRFRHPYAVVAATFEDRRDPAPAEWHGVPVFSAWVARADEADAGDPPAGGDPVPRLV